MTTLTFYRQARADGGIRSGVSLNNATVLSSFARSKRGENPRLLWFVDVRCEGRLPADSEKVRQWLLDHVETIRKGLNALAAKVEPGLDVPSWPVREVLRNGASGARITMVCTAARRTEALEMAGIIRDIAKHWERYISEMRVLEPVG